jgi:hypothetical protein
MGLSPVNYLVVIDVSPDDFERRAEVNTGFLAAYVRNGNTHRLLLSIQTAHA